jgi:hypothetical protein
LRPVVVGFWAATRPERVRTRMAVERMMLVEDSIVVLVVERLDTGCKRSGRC